MAYTYKETFGADTGGSVAVGTYASELDLATRITAGSNYTVTQVGLYLAKTGAPTGTLVACIYADDGGTPPHPTGAALGTSTNNLDVTTLTGSFVEKLFQFTGVELTSGTKYWIGPTVSGSSENVNIHVDWNYGDYNETLYTDYYNSRTTWEGRANRQAYVKTYETEGGAALNISVAEEVRSVTIVS